MEALFVSMDFDPKMFRDMRNVAELVGGNLGLTEKGRVCIYGESLDAVAAVSLITGEAWPWGYVEAEDDSTLVFAF